MGKISVHNGQGSPAGDRKETDMKIAELSQELTRADFINILKSLPDDEVFTIQEISEKKGLSSAILSRVIRCTGLDEYKCKIRQNKYYGNPVAIKKLKEMRERKYEDK